jgi:hypothetical protein
LTIHNIGFVDDAAHAADWRIGSDPKRRLHQCPASPLEKNVIGYGAIGVDLEMTTLRRGTGATFSLGSSRNTGHFTNGKAQARREDVVDVCVCMLDLMAEVSALQTREAFMCLPQKNLRELFSRGDVLSLHKKGSRES